MPDLINLVGRLRAFERGRAVQIASHLQVNIQSHARVLCPIAMAGEDTTVHAIAVGRIGAAPEIRVVPDPRMRDDHYALIGWVGGLVEDYFMRCRQAGDFPQIWVSSGAAVGHLDTLADRLRFTRDCPPIRRLGELLSYATERYPVAGQQALVPATGALAAHYCTGQQESEDDHLGTFLTWLDPPTGRDIHAALEMAEHEPMGVKTDPEFDRYHLQPLVTAYDRARGSGASPAELQRRARAIEGALTPIVNNIYCAVQRALTYLIGQFPPANLLADLASREAYDFASFMKARDEGQPLPYRDRPKAATFKIAAREEAAQNTEKAKLYGDAAAQARARLAGKILIGTVAGVVARRVPGRTIYQFSVVTPQSNLHLRQGDDLALISDPRLQCCVLSVERTGANSKVSFLLTKGMRAVGCPLDGVDIELGPPPPDWSRLGRERKKMSERLHTQPWTHVEAVSVVRGSSVPRPNNLAAAVEALR